MKFIALRPLFSTQSALGDVAEVKDAVRNKRNLMFAVLGHFN